MAKGSGDDATWESLYNLQHQFGAKCSKRGGIFKTLIGDVVLIA